MSTQALEIDIWYGHEQSFGTRGIPQHAVNILGSVRPAPSVQKLYFRLNGGDPSPLAVGPDRKRLSKPGDFNIEIDVERLRDGINHIAVFAVDHRDRMYSAEIRVHYEASDAPRIPYEVRWDERIPIGNAAQVVDGRWIVRDGAVRTAEPGYDRLIAIGDIRWKNYIVTVPVTIHGYDPSGVRPISCGQNVGVVVRWQGHYDWDGKQPRSGYYPYGALAIYEHHIFKDPRNFHLRLYGNNVEPLTERTSGKKLATGVPYMFKVSVQDIPDSTAYYRFKVWKADEREPDEWDLEGFGFLGEHPSGSLLLIAHHTDASFGTVTVAPIETGG